MEKWLESLCFGDDIGEHETLEVLRTEIDPDED
jgi:hypothetical protein